MTEKPYEKIITEKFAFLLGNGFSYEYLYEKPSDMSCVYIYRFTKLGAYIDLRFVSGDDKQCNCVVYTGERRFPNLPKRQKKIFNRFKLSHLFKKATMEEKLALYAEALEAEVSGGNIYGIPLN